MLCYISSKNVQVWNCCLPFISVYCPEIGLFLRKYPIYSQLFAKIGSNFAL